MAELDAFFAARIPAGWFTGPVRIDADDDEILCVGTLPAGRSRVMAGMLSVVKRVVVPS